MVGVERGKYKVLPLLKIRRGKGGTKGQELGELPFLLVKVLIGTHGFWENHKVSSQIPLWTNSSKKITQQTGDQMLELKQVRSTETSYQTKATFPIQERKTGKPFFLNGNIREPRSRS